MRALAGHQVFWELGFINPMKSKIENSENAHSHAPIRPQKCLWYISKLAFLKRADE